MYSIALDMILLFFCGVLLLWTTWKDKNKIYGQPLIFHNYFSKKYFQKMTC